MDLVKCPRCGEEYSPSYRKCPFCEEEDTPKKVKRKMHSGHRMSDKKRTHSSRGALVTVLVLVVGLLTWYLFGERIMARFAKDPVEQPPVEEVTPPDDTVTDDPFYDPNAGEGEQPTTDDPNAVVPPDATTPPENDPAAQQPGSTTVDVSSLSIKTNVGGTLPQGPDGAYDCTIRRGESFRFIVSGTEATAAWATENEGIAMIAADGTVTPVSSGITNFTATVGGATLHGILRVK